MGEKLWSIQEKGRSLERWISEKLKINLYFERQSKASNFWDDNSQSQPQGSKNWYP